MVPFGFERKEQERQIDDKVGAPQYKRLYLNVKAIRTDTGKLIPKSFELEGRTYKIIKIIDVADGKSFKEKVHAVRFTCLCGNNRFQLFFEDNGFGNQRFYIELKEGY